MDAHRQWSSHDGQDPANGEVEHDEDEEGEFPVRIGKAENQIHCRDDDEVGVKSAKVRLVEDACWRVRSIWLGCWSTFFLGGFKQHGTQCTQDSAIDTVRGHKCGKGVPIGIRSTGVVATDGNSQRNSANRDAEAQQSEENMNSGIDAVLR